MSFESAPVVKLTADLVATPSPSQLSNRVIVDQLQSWFSQRGFDIERLGYDDESGERKESLVALFGEGRPGIGFFSHSDTVPGGDGWSPYEPTIEGNRLIGRGSCDMKGPLAASMIATASFEPTSLRRSVAVIVTADEEVGFGGAIQVLEESKLLAKRGWPEVGVIPEPTELKPVYAHKGGYFIRVTAQGVAAHTSTDRGESANFRLAPFLAEMSELALQFRTDPDFKDERFEPATNGFNMVLDDGGTAVNVTAAQSVATLSFRAMPGVDSQATIEAVVSRARAHGLDVEVEGRPAFLTDPASELIQTCLKITGETEAHTVPFGTEAMIFQEKLSQVVLGPGNIAQAHTKGEFIDVEELCRSVDIYRDLIRHYAG